jgi:hypothetical protein
MVEEDVRFASWQGSDPLGFYREQGWSHVEGCGCLGTHKNLKYYYQKYFFTMLAHQIFTYTRERYPHSLALDSPLTENTTYVYPINFLASGSRDMHHANNKAVDYLFRTLCKPEYDQIQVEDLACKNWDKLKVAHTGNNQVEAMMFATYRREYENFNHIPGESIDTTFQRFTML